jgi:hypothetical protein
MLADDVGAKSTRSPAPLPLLFSEMFCQPFTTSSLTVNVGRAFQVNRAPLE